MPLPPPPNQVYSAFSFIGFVLCAIPFYWHLEAWNTGTCLFMFWTGLGCLVQCINSIVWNGNMINRAPIYCVIATRIQIALNVAIPACSLCIQRRLYNIATVKAVMITRSEKRRAIIYDLLLGIGLPILQIVAEYVVDTNRYLIFEDFGPYFAIAVTPLAFVLFYAWPLAIGCVSFYYCVTTIYTFYKRHRQFMEISVSNPGLNRSRYFRLMAISVVDICATIPLSTYYIVYNAKSGVTPYISWSNIHQNYSAVIQFSSVEWKNNPSSVSGLELFRWSNVICAFLFFSLFGFADEARQHYRRVYTTLASRIGYSTFTLQGSSHATSSVPFVKSKGGVIVSVVTTGNLADRRRSSISFSDQPTAPPSIALSSDLKTDFKVEDFSVSDNMTTVSVESFIDPAMHDHLPAPAAGIHHPHTHSGAEAV